MGSSKGFLGLKILWKGETGQMGPFVFLFTSMRAREKRMYEQACEKHPCSHIFHGLAHTFFTGSHPMD